MTIYNCRVPKLNILIGQVKKVDIDESASAILSDLHRLSFFCIHEFSSVLFAFCLHEQQRSIFSSICLFVSVWFFRLITFSWTSYSKNLI